MLDNLSHRLIGAPQIFRYFQRNSNNDLCDAGAVLSPTELWTQMWTGQFVGLKLLTDSPSFLGFSVSRRRGWQLFFTKDTSFRKTTPNFALHFILLERRCNGPLVRYYIAPDSYLWGKCHNATFQQGGGWRVCALMQPSSSTGWVCWFSTVLRVVWVFAPSWLNNWSETI